MARRRRGRVANDINANAYHTPRTKALPLSLTRDVFPSQLEMFDLPALEDRRTFHPEGPARPARSPRRPRHRLSVPKKYQYSLKKSYVPHEVGFQDPQKVLVCVRRKRRREVLHALRKAGKRGQKRPRRNFYSSISCR